MEGLILVSRSPLSQLGVFGDRVAELGQWSRFVDERHQILGLYLCCELLNHICSADIGQGQLLQK